MSIVTTGVIFRVLGPVVVRVPPRTVAVDEPRRRAVMAALLLNQGRTVTWQQLVRLVWGDERPASSRKALHVYVSKIRQAIADIPDTAIVTQPDGYQFSCVPDSVDLHVFRNMVATSRQVTDDRLRRDILTNALALWRGEPFTGVAPGGLHEWVAPRLKEERLVAIEECYAARLRLGEYGAVIDPLKVAVAEYPLRERLVELLMSALHVCGRHLEASHVYHRLRAALHREIGVQPNQTLATLHEAILTIDVTRDRRPTLTAAGFIGQGRGLLEKGDQDRALACFYAGRAEARDRGDDASLRVVDTMITQLTSPVERAP
ncbi:AfsR/SARP family transcriptional regulator [Micromonospora echinofusca]|uniref:AfsR/SARP family transcriptional regulator n=1 Tax=Micromonospora echinofusca TaxID=47858 RepID=UPI0034237950